MLLNCYLYVTRILLQGGKSSSKLFEVHPHLVFSCEVLLGGTFREAKTCLKSIHTSSCKSVPVGQLKLWPSTLSESRFKALPAEALTVMGGLPASYTSYRSGDRFR